MSRSLGIPVKLLHEAAGHVVTVELKTREVYWGSMIECEDNWNCQIENITFTAKDGKVSQLEHVFIRGSRVRFIIIPDMLKNVPMFKRLEARIRGKGSTIGVGRGRAVAMRARGAGGRAGGPPVGGGRGEEVDLSRMLRELLSGRGTRSLAIEKTPMPATSSLVCCLSAESTFSCGVF